MKEQWIETWTDFKSLVITKKKLPVQYDDLQKWYDINAAENGNTYRVRLVKSAYISQFEGIDSEQAQTDVTDFEINYKDDANTALEQRTYDGIKRSATSLYQEEDSFYIKGDKVNIAISSADRIEFQFAFAMKLVGVNAFWTDADVGDYLECSVGYYDGEEWVEVDKYGEILYLRGTDKADISTSDYASIPAGLVIRIEYTNISDSSTKDFLCWLKCYR